MTDNSFFLSTKPLLSQKRMKNEKDRASIYYHILLTCMQKQQFQDQLEGEIKGLTNDTLYLYGTDALYDRIDTIYAEKGKFSYNLNIDSTVIDTLTTAVLLINGHVEYPVFWIKEITRNFFQSGKEFVR